MARVWRGIHSSPTLVETTTKGTGQAIEGRDEGKGRNEAAGVSFGKDKWLLRTIAGRWLDCWSARVLF